MKQHETRTAAIRPCGPSDVADVLAIINAAAEAYRYVIPPDCWHEPYMPAEDLASELADGVVFNGFFLEDRLVGVMGVQRRRNADLIRHAYVRPDCQGRGVGSRLLRHLCRDMGSPVLIGTWAVADWASRFYEGHGFARVADGDIAPLLRTYWTVPERQVAASIVLACPPLNGCAADLLISGASAAAHVPES